MQLKLSCSHTNDGDDDCPNLGSHRVVGVDRATDPAQLQQSHTHTFNNRNQHDDHGNNKEKPVKIIWKLKLKINEPNSVGSSGPSGCGIGPNNKAFE